ncbi:MAG: hypothetical protein V2B14_03320 [bacterium]
MLANMKNPINLRRLRSKKNSNFNYNLVLKDDIWKQGILLLRSGKYLTKDIIDKLINFGIHEINVHLDEEDENDYEYYEDENSAIEELKKNFIKTQNILVIDNNFRDANYLTRTLMCVGFKQRNIYVITNAKLIKKYFESKNFAHLFIDFNLYKNNTQIVDNLNLKNINIFLTTLLSEIKTSIRELESNIDSLETKIILKPVMAGHLRNLINQSVDRDFCRLLRNKPKI